MSRSAVRDPLTSAPTSCLTKLGPDDDVEAYLEVFHWAHILSPFLTGPAQQTSQDLTPERASPYPALKQAILAYYGHSLARAQRFHDWRFDASHGCHTDCHTDSDLSTWQAYPVAGRQ